MRFIAEITILISLRRSNTFFSFLCYFVSLCRYLYVCVLLHDCLLSACYSVAVLWTVCPCFSKFASDQVNFESYSNQIEIHLFLY